MQNTDTSTALNEVMTQALLRLQALVHNDPAQHSPDALLMTCVGKN